MIYAYGLRAPRTVLAFTGVLGTACTPAPGADSTTDGTETTTADASETGGSTAAVDGSTTDDATGDDATTDDATGGLDPCATLGAGAEPLFTRPAGVFVFRDAPGYRWLRGFIDGGPRVPFHQESEREGACRLLTYSPSACDPACTAPAVCIDEVCVTEPSGLSAGAVTLTGVGEQSHAVTEGPLHDYYWDHEGNDVITMPGLAAAGADVGAFELEVCPITAPTPADDWSALLAARAPGQDVALTWSDPVDSARIYLRMTTGIGTHGGISPVEIECEGPDVGTLVLPGAYLDALYADGWSCGECGGNDLVRYHAAEVDAGGTTVQLRAEASAGFWFIP